MTLLPWEARLIYKCSSFISSDGAGKNWSGNCFISFFSLYRASFPFQNALLADPGQLHTDAEKEHVLHDFSML